MEEAILKEIKYFHEALESHKEQAFDIKDQLTRSVSNIATFIAFGTRFEYDAEQLANLQFQEFVMIATITEVFPFLRVSFTTRDISVCFFQL